MEKIARALNRPLVKLIPSYREPVDFLGYPYPSPDKGNYVYLPPKWVTVVKELRNVILFLDELSTSPPQVQNAVFRLVAERVFGDEEPLPEEVSIVAAGNPPEYSWSAYTLTPPLANRFVHVDWVRGGLTPDYLYRVLTSKDQLPSEIPIIDMERYKEEYPTVFELVFSFLSGVGEKGLLSPPKAGRGEDVRGFPTPRSWVEFCIPLVTAWKVTNLPVSTLYCIVEGCVGEEMAKAFVPFVVTLRERIPTPTQILHGDETFPDEHDLLLFSLSEVLSYLSRTGDETEFKTLISKLIKKGEGLPDDLLLTIHGRLLNFLERTGWSSRPETQEWVKFVEGRIFSSPSKKVRK